MAFAGGSPDAQHRGQKGDTVTGLPYFSNGLCTGTNIDNGGLKSDQRKIDPTLVGADTNYKNDQLGLYFQDDWALTLRRQQRA